MKRHFSATISALMCAAMLFNISSIGIVKADTIAEMEAQVDALEQKANELEEELAEIQSRTAAVKEEKYQVEQEINSLNEEINNLNAQIAILSDDIAKSEQQLEATEAARQQQFDLYCDRVRTMEEGGRIDYIEVLLGSTSISDFISRMSVIGEIMRYDDNLQKQIVSMGKQIEEVKQSLEIARQTQQEVLDEKNAAQDALEEKHAQQEKLIEELNYLESQTQNELTVTKEEADELDSKIAEQKELLRKMQEEAAQNAAAAGKLDEYQASQEFTVSGSWYWPLPGHYIVTDLFGGRIHPIFGYYCSHTGMDIGCGYGVPIGAAKAGVVIRASYYGGYGNCVEIDHGDGTVTRYGHMSGYAVSFGDVVYQGQTIGYIGSTGNSTGPHLHLEVIMNGSRVDPQPFFGGLPWTYA